MLSLHDRSICCQILREVGDYVSGTLDGPGGPGEAGGGGGVDPGGVVHEIAGKGRPLDLVLRQVPGQLVDNGGHHLHVTEFICSLMISITVMKTRFSVPRIDPRGERPSWRRVFGAGAFPGGR